MANIYYASTASFCVENARELGIPAALLLDKIVRLSKSTPRDDGFCWYTAKQFEEETSLKEDAFLRAKKTLQSHGVVETKNTYIIGTMTKCSHFRLLPQGDSQECETGSKPVVETGSEPVSVNTIKYNEQSRNLASQVSERPAEPLVHAGFAGDQKKKGEAGETQPNPLVESQKCGDPFGGELKATSVRPDKQTKPNKRREFAILSNLYKKYGWRGKPNANEATLLHSALSVGWSPQEVDQMIAWQNTDEFYSKAALVTRLSDSAFKKYDAVRRSEKPTTPKGIW